MKGTYEDAITVCRTLTDAGHVAYLAGGCVRDLLLGYIPSDYDIATSARPERVCQLFERTVPVGISFGVVKVVLGDTRELDVATFRTDGTYSDNRRPDTVNYTESAEEDVKRRDFTVNALLMDADGKIIDYVGGQEDLKNKILKAVGDPVARFTEDALRMMRAVRFSVKYDLRLTPDTMTAIQDNCKLISSVSKERITEELAKMLTGGKADRAYFLLEITNLFNRIFPFQYSNSASAKWEQMIQFSKMPEGSTFVLPYALLLDSVRFNDKEVCEQALCLTREQITSSARLIKNSESLLRFGRSTRAEQRRMANLPNLRLCQDFIFCKDYPYESTVYPSGVPALIEQRLALGMPDRLITGNDLKEWGYHENKTFTAMLEAVYDGQLEDKISTKEQAREFLLTSFPAARRTLSDGTIVDGMSKVTYAACCNLCTVTMRFDAEGLPTGQVDWSTLSNFQNCTANARDFYAKCTNKRGQYRYCRGRKAKHKFVKVCI